MKRTLIVIALTLALIMVFSGVAMGNTSLNVNFNVENPDIYVHTYKPGPAPGGTHHTSGTASFSLTGTGSAQGWIHSTTSGQFQSTSLGPDGVPGYTTNQPHVFGAYTAQSGDFKSDFTAMSDYLRPKESARHRTWSSHNAEFFGVDEGGVSVQGYATGVSHLQGSFFELTQAGQYFAKELVPDGDVSFKLAGKANVERLKVSSLYGTVMHKYLGLTENQDDKLENPFEKLNGITFSALAYDDGGSLIGISGSTEGRAYPTYPAQQDVRHVLRQQRGLGFVIETDSFAYLEGWVNTTYPNTYGVAEDGLIQGASWMTHADRPNWSHPYNPFPELFPQEGPEYWVED